MRFVRDALEKFSMCTIAESEAGFQIFALVHLHTENITDGSSIEMELLRSLVRQAMNVTTSF